MHLKFAYPILDIFLDFASINKYKKATMSKQQNGIENKGSRRVIIIVIFQNQIQSFSE